MDCDISNFLILLAPPLPNNVHGGTNSNGLKGIPRHFSKDSLFVQNDIHIKTLQIDCDISNFLTLLVPPFQKFQGVHYLCKTIFIQKPFK